MIVLGTLACRGWGNVIWPLGLLVSQEPKLVPGPPGLVWARLLSPDLLAYSQGIMGLAGSLLNSPTFDFNN